MDAVFQVYSEFRSTEQKVVNSNTYFNTPRGCTFYRSFNYFCAYLVRRYVVAATLVGLSKERPILDHHAKAHIHEIRQISGEIHPKPYKIRCFNKNSSVWGVHGGGYDPGFHEIQGHSPSPAFIKLNSFG